MQRLSLTVCLALCTVVACGGGEAPPAVPVASTPVAVPEPTPTPAVVVAAPTPTIVAPIPPPDADGDGVPDATDNCPAMANADQRNTDGATESIVSGDACDEDDDGDGAPDAEETTLGADMVVTDPLNPDTDHDAIPDGRDNCPLQENPKQQDADGDTFGLPCDCNDTAASIHPAAVDAPDITYLDKNCDGIDGTIRTAVFVASQGDDTSAGTLAAPVATLARGLVLAAGTRDLYLEEGAYDPAGVVWPAVARLYGGYATTDPAQPFAAREVRAHPTILRNGAAITLTIGAPAGAVTLDGLFLENLSTAPTSVVLAIDHAAVTLRDCTLLGSLKGDVTIGLWVGDAAEAVLEGDWIDPRGAPGEAASIGLVQTDGVMHAAHSIVRGGAGKQTEGVVLTGGAATLVHNTVDGGSTAAGALVARALRFADVTPVLVNNVFLTHTAALDQVAVWCAQGTLTGVTMRRNLLAVAPPGQGDPLFVDCDGAFYDAAAMIALQLSGVSDNIGYDGGVATFLMLPDPLDQNNSGYVLAAGSPAIGAADVGASMEIADVDGHVRDFTGTTREAPYDLGAMENQ